MFPFRSKKYQEEQRKLPVNAEVTAAASQWILRREQLPEYRFALELLSQGEKEAVFWQEWDRLDAFAQRDLARETFAEGWDRLLAGYGGYNQTQRIQVIEALGYIHHPDVIAFLLNELKKEDENSRLAASSALKKQDPLLTIEPMLDALNKPEVFLASRIYDVLKAIGPKLVPVIMHKITQSDLSGQVVMTQLLGAFGDETVIPLLGELTRHEHYPIRKVAVEALSQIGTEDIWPFLAPLIDDANWQIRLLVVDAIDRHHLRQGYPLLREALTREDDRLVKDMMQDLLTKLGKEESPEAFQWFREMKGQVAHDEEHDSGSYSSRRYSRRAHRATDRARDINQSI